MKHYLFSAAVFILFLCAGASASEGQPLLNGHRAMILDLSSRNGSAATEVVALKHCFDIYAIQYTVTSSIASAAASPVIYTAGDLRNTTFSSAELQQLYEYVENGGVLVSQVVIGNKLFPLFGIKDLHESRTRYTVAFKDRADDCALSYLDRPEERSVSLGSRKIYREVIWTHAFAVSGAKALASTDDGRTIFSVNQYGSGSAYALGVSLSDAVLLPHVGSDYEAQRAWINGFEPGSDVFLLLMKSIYERYAGTCVYLSTVPYGRKTVLMLSHDVDAQMSFANMVEYARLEKRFGVSGTYFITTKYFTDSSDIGYYDAERIGYVRQVKELGGDIASHTVSHLVSFDALPVGTRDTVKGNYKTASPTVFGEVKVSKELLDRDIPSQNTVTFRSGYLRYPERLAEVLEQCGYRYDSSFSADDIMCNYAYRAFRRRNVGAEPSSIIEIPVVFDDSQGLLTPRNMNELVAKWADIIRANSDNEAISVLLIHPSETGYKLKAEENLLSLISGKDAWIGSITAYGDFWTHRNSVVFDSVLQDSVLTLKITGAVPDERISFCVRNTPQIKEIRIIDSKNRTLKVERTDTPDKMYLRCKAFP